MVDFIISNNNESTYFFNAKVVEDKLLIENYFFNIVNDSKVNSLDMINKLKLNNADNAYSNLSSYSNKNKYTLKLYDYFGLPFLVIQKILDSIDGRECIIGKLKFNSLSWSKITQYENPDIINKKFEIFKILAEEINILVETFYRDKIIDGPLFDNTCKLFIETQNILSKICPFVKQSNYMGEKFKSKNEDPIEIPNYLNKKFLNSFNLKNNNEYVSVIKHFFKISIKFEQVLITIPDDYLNNTEINNEEDKIFKKLDQKILITNFYVNAIIKMIIYDFRNIFIKLLKE